MREVFKVWVQVERQLIGPDEEQEMCEDVDLPDEVGSFETEQEAQDFAVMLAGAADTQKAAEDMLNALDEQPGPVTDILWQTWGTATPGPASYWEQRWNLYSNALIALRRAMGRSAAVNAGVTP